MSFRAGLHNFSKGVLSPELWGRVDIATYNAAVRQAKNVVVLKYGGLQKRPGTRLVYEITDGPKRLLPFEYSIDFTYALLMGQGTMRPATNGGMVLEEGLLVTAITKEAQAKITAAYHGYEVGDEVYFLSIDGMLEINGRFGTVVAVQDENNFTVNINSTGFGAFSGSGGGVERVGAPPAPPPPPPVPPPVSPEPEPDVGGGDIPYWKQYDNFEQQ